MSGLSGGQGMPVESSNRDLGSALLVLLVVAGQVLDSVEGVVALGLAVLEPYFAKMA